MKISLLSPAENISWWEFHVFPRTSMIWKPRLVHQRMAEKHYDIKHIVVVKSTSPYMIYHMVFLSCGKQLLLFDKQAHQIITAVIFVSPALWHGCPQLCHHQRSTSVFHLKYHQI